MRERPPLPSVPPGEQPRLLDQVRRLTRLRHYSIRTEEAYVTWARRFINFHGQTHPRELREPEVEAFLTYLAAERNVSSSTQNQAFNALLFLYEGVLREPLEEVDALRAGKKVKLPLWLQKSDAKKLLAELQGVHKLVASLIFGGGLRLMEALRLRVHDIDFLKREITVHSGKGGRSRVTVLPATVEPQLKRQLRKVKELFRQDIDNGTANVYLPYKLAQKYPKAPKQLGWQYVFPAARCYRLRQSALSWLRVSLLVPLFRC